MPSIDLLSTIKSELTTEVSELIRCVHRVGRAAREVERVRQILGDIQENSRLFARKHCHVYAYRIDLVPEDCREGELVVFEVNDHLVDRNCCPILSSREIFEYYQVLTGLGKYSPIRLLEFLNALGYVEYTGRVSRFEQVPNEFMHVWMERGSGILIVDQESDDEHSTLAA